MRRSRYHLDDEGLERRYTPGGLYYVGVALLAATLFAFANTLARTGRVDLVNALLVLALLASLIASWRMITVGTEIVRVRGFGWKKSFRLEDLKGSRTDADDPDPLTYPFFSKQHTTTYVAAGFTFFDEHGHRAFRVSPWLHRSRECARLIRSRMRTVHEDHR